MNRYTVSSQCPECGGPLDFSEGANSVRCDHCSSNLFVTGRGRVLTYFVEPAIDIHRAIARAGLHYQEQGAEHRIHDAKLRFIPYYRMTCQELAWRLKDKDVIAAEQDAPGALEIDTWSGSTRNWLSGTLLPAARPLDIGRPLGTELRDFELHDRFIEKNFVGADLHGVGAYSIGIRSSTLLLRPFNAEQVRALGEIVAPDVSAEKAMERGLLAGDATPYHETVGRILSIIYFPIWFVHLESQGTQSVAMVDGISGEVEGPLEPRVEQGLKIDPGQSLETAGFRPFRCPSCGWGSLPLAPDDSVFFCTSCSRAWQLVGHDLLPVPFQLAAASMEHPTYLPFWKLEGETSTLVAAFRYRRIESAQQMSSAFSPSAESEEGTLAKGASVVGCYYDLEDAIALARFHRSVAEAKRVSDLEHAATADVHFGSAVVRWIPFGGDGSLLIEPQTRQSVFRQLIF